MSRVERAFWVREPGHGEIRPVPVDAPGAGNALVRTRFSGISRGTETLVFAGRVPRSEFATMRAPFQEGEFPGPVKYGYLSVGVVEDGPVELHGRTVFCLHPHQTAFVVPAEALAVVPADVPPRRAVLAGVLETAVNALWDAPPLLGDHVTVVGAGLVGCCVARLLVRHPGVRVTLVDIDPDRRATAEALEVAFADPESAPGDQDTVYHASASAAGLQRSIELLKLEGTVVDLSWYGDSQVGLALGGAFHSKRLTIRSSQVGHVSAARRTTRSRGDRLRLALELLRDPAFDALLSGSSPFDDLPSVMAELASGRLHALCHTIAYQDG